VIDFPLFGLHQGWSGPRWLDFIDSGPGKPADWVWLAHGERHGPARGHPWVLVGNFRGLTGHPLGDLGGARDAELAEKGLLLLMNWLAPELESRDRRRFWRNSMIYLHRRAIRRTSWASAGWTVDRKAVSARFARFAGGWTGHAVAGGIGIVVVATGVSPHAIELQRIGPEMDYHAALAEPIIYPDALKSSLSAALGPHAGQLRPRRLNSDQRRILAADWAETHGETLVPTDRRPAPVGS
jgi:hypothetical protein